MLQLYKEFFEKIQYELRKINQFIKKKTKKDSFYLFLPSVLLLYDVRYMFTIYINLNLKNAKYFHSSD